MQHDEPLLLAPDDNQALAVVHQASAHAVALASHVSQDQDYLVALRELQEGRWERAVPMLRALQLRYPAAPEVAELLQEAAFRVSIERTWVDKVQGRQGFTLPLRSWLPAVAVLALGALLLVGVISYGRGQRVNALIDQQADLLQLARAALAAGQHREALDLFAQLLAQNPASPEARQGEYETRRQLQLATDYQLALDQMAAGHYQQAQLLLQNLERQTPNYRDVTALLQEIKTNLGAPQLLANAEDAFAKGLWVTAISQYEDLRRFDSDYEASTVQEHLALAYLRAGQQVVALRPYDSTAPQQAKAYFKKAAELNATDAVRQTEEERLAAYLEGARLVEQNAYEQSIKVLFPLYETAPTYFGGYVAELLYRAYVGLAESAVQAADLEKAHTLYARLVALGLDNSGAAQQRLTALDLLLAPTPTPSPPAPIAPPPVTAPVLAATPTASASDQYRGWILFRSNRNGAEALYLMRADGSELQPAPAALAATYDQLYQQQQQRADGSQRLYVKRVADVSAENIFTALTPATGEERERMVTAYHGAEYDPVWSPDGQWIAFVANQTGNDEIWVIDAAGSQGRQLTLNEWPWDKHPSFAPDGQQIVFYSNRTGVRQIWRMNGDGSHQQNLSNNGFEEWDPLWLR